MRIGKRVVSQGVGEQRPTFPFELWARPSVKCRAASPMRRIRQKETKGRTSSASRGR